MHVGGAYVSVCMCGVHTCVCMCGMHTCVCMWGCICECVACFATEGLMGGTREGLRGRGARNV